MIVTPVDTAFNRLKSAEPKLRKLGATYIAANPAPGRLLEIQKAFLLEQEPGIFKWLALAMARIGSKGSLKILQDKLLKTEDADAADWLALSISWLQEDRSNPSIVRMLRSSDSHTRRHAAALAWEHPALDETTLGILRRSLDDEDPDVRRWATLALGTCGHANYADPVAVGLDDDNFLNREWAANALGRLRNPDAASSLMPALQDPNPRVREWAIKSLGMCASSPSVFRILTEVFQTESDEECREGLVTTVSKFGPVASRKRFLIRVLKEDPSLLVRLASARALGSTPELCNDPESLQVLEQVGRTTTASALRREILSTLFTTASTTEKATIRNVASKPRNRVLMTLALSDEAPVAMTGTEGQQSGPRQYDIGLIVPLKEEFREVQEILGMKRHFTHGTDTYYEFELPSANPNRAFKGIALFVGRMGEVRAATAATRLLERNTIAIVVNLGIAGALDTDASLGDVVVATDVESYLQASKAESDGNEGWHYKYSGDGFKTDDLLLDRAENLELAMRAEYSQWQSVCAEELRVNISSEQRNKLLNEALLSKKPALYEGKFACGPTVGSAEAFAEELMNHDRKYFALEMESAGIALAVHESAKASRTIYIRGISDFADERKKELDVSTSGGVRVLAVRNATRLLITLASTLHPSSL